MVSNLTCCLKLILFLKFKNSNWALAERFHLSLIWRLHVWLLGKFVKAPSHRLQIKHNFLLKWTCSLKNVVASAMTEVTEEYLQLDLQRSWPLLQASMGLCFSSRFVWVFLADEEALKSLWDCYPFAASLSTGWLLSFYLGHYLIWTNRHLWSDSCLDIKVS